jgi:hypothetical protein
MLYDVSIILKEVVKERFKSQSKTLHSDDITKFVRLMDKIYLKAE